MGRQIRPARVYQTALSNVSSQLARGRNRVAPPWLKALEAIPPHQTEVRQCAVQHTAPSDEHHLPRNLYKPALIVYPEDELRRDFYRDHPWELARPRVILEMDGKDAQYLDWSKGVRQPHTALTGECVVQRQLWLMENENLSKEQAYDKARREFYRLRHEEDVERRIAQEEARMVGAYFGKTTSQVGMELEDKRHEAWKKYAAKHIAKNEAMRGESYSSFGGEMSEEEAQE